MGSVIDWLNTNSGAVTAAATVVLAALTAVYVGATYRMMSFMREQTALLRGQADAQLEHAREDRAREDSAAQIQLFISRTDYQSANEVRIQVLNRGGDARSLKFMSSGFSWEPRELGGWLNGAVEQITLRSLPGTGTAVLRLDVSYVDSRIQQRVTSYYLRRDGGFSLEEVPSEISGGV